MNASGTGGEWVVIGGIVLSAILTWIGSIIVRRLREPTRIESLWDQVDTLSKEIYGDEEKKTLGLKRRLENAERRDATKGRVIRDLAQQWPTGSIPRLNPADILELEEDTIPAHWKVKPT